MVQTKGQPTPRSPRPLHRPFKGHCERCGEEYIVERGGSFGDRDYYELFHEHMNLMHRFKLAAQFVFYLMRARNAAK